MPTSGAGELGTGGGGQSALGASGLPLHQPAVPRARGPASGLGSGASGQKGRNCTAGRRTGRRRIVRRDVERGRTGDIAHLEPAEYFAFYSLCQVFIFAVYSPALFPTTSLLSNFATPAVLWDSHFMVRLPISARAFLVAVLSLPSLWASAQTPPPQQPQKPATAAKPPAQQPPGQAQQPATAEPIPSPVSRHYPILIVAIGTEPFWSLRLGMKGPERLDRANYPPMVLEPGDVTSDQATGAWTYNAKDSVTGAAVAVKLTREPCSDNMSDIKYTFRVELQHAQIGALNGCGQSAPEKFPEFRKKNQIDMPDDIDPNAKDKDKDKKTVLDPIIKFQSPVDVAYLDSAGRVIVVHGTVHKTASPSGTELALSHDGKKLLFTFSVSKTSPDRSIMLYEFDTGRSRLIAGNNMRQAFWSPDDSRIAYLKYNGQIWQVWTAPVSAPDSATLFSSQNVDSLHGWINANTILASDMQNAYWISEDKPAQTVPLKDIYGPTFQIMSSDTMRVCPINSDLLLVSAYYLNAPAGTPTDAMGMNQTFFLYEIQSKRRTVLGPVDAFARNAEWSRDGLQIFFTKGVPGKGPLVTDRIFWDGTGEKRFSSGADLVIGR